MENQLFSKIYKSIPSHIGELYLDQDARQIIAKEIELNLKDDCDHNWNTVSQIKLIDPLFCKKCGKIKCI